MEDCHRLKLVSDNSPSQSLTPKASRPLKENLRASFSKESFFIDGDEISFDGNHVIVTRDGKLLGRCRWSECTDRTLAKTVAEGTRVQGALVPGMEREEYTVKGDKATSKDGKTWSTTARKPKTSSKRPADATQTKPGTPKKSDNLPPGARWITMRPNDAEKGVPVLIQERPDGSAVVIGGAGGKLNQLHLKKLNSPEQWKQRSAERKVKREAKEKKRLESMTDEQRQAETENLSQIKEYHLTQRHENAIATLDAMDKHGLEHGLTDEHREALSIPPAPDADPADVEEWKRLTQEATKKVQEVHRAYEHKLVTDHEARAAARAGDTPLEDNAGALIEDRDHVAANLEGEDISSLHQLPDGRWLVRNANGREADKVYDSWIQAAKEHAGNVAEADADGMPSQPDEFYQPNTWVRAAKDDIGFNPVAARDMARLSAERKGIGNSEKAARRALQQGNPFEPGLDVGAVTDTAVSAIDALEAKAGVLEDAVINSNLLQLADMVDAKGLKKHLSFGGYAKLGEISSDVLKQNVMDPGLVDALGHNEAAKVLAYSIRQNVSPNEYDRIAAAQAAMHAETSRQVAEQAVEDAQPLVEHMAGLHNRILELEAQKGEGGYTPDQLIEVDNLSYQAKVAHESLQKQLGTVVGQLQASAAMVVALESRSDDLRFDLKGDLGDLIPGSLSAVDALDDEKKPTIWDAYGLDGDDFDIQDGPDGQLAQIKESGLKKLIAEQYSEEDREAYERAIAIKRGDFDEETFLPSGFAYRAKGTFTDLRAEAEQFGVNLDIQAGMDEGQMQDAIRSYIGARVANGENPLSVRQDIFSPELYLNLGVDDQVKDAATAALNALDKDLISGNRVSDKAVVQAYQDLGDAEAAKQRKTRKTDDLETLHKQTIDHEIAVDAVHRSLAAFPMAKTALKPMEQLTAKDRRWLREYAITQVMGEEIEEKRQLEKPSDAGEPAETMTDLFGNVVSAADIAQAQSDDGPELSQWQRFSKIMGGDAKAYTAIRDKLKGQFFNRFTGAYGAIAGKPLAVGEQKLEHVDRLLLAQLPESQRQEMLDFIRSREQSDVAKIRSRQGGKFATEIDDEWLQKLQDIKGDNRQISLLQADTGITSAIDWQRTTLGSTAEEQLSAALDQVLPNFEQLDNGVGIYPELNWGGQFVAHQRGLKFLEQQKKIGCHFSAGCVHGSTQLACEKTGVTQSFYEWWVSGDRPWVKALDESRNSTEVVQASPVFVKAYGPMYRVTLENGQSIITTAGHRFLGKNGWSKLSELGVGTAIAVASSETILPLFHYPRRHHKCLQSTALLCDQSGPASASQSIWDGRHQETLQRPVAVSSALSIAGDALGSLTAWSHLKYFESECRASSASEQRKFFQPPWLGQSVSSSFSDLCTDALMRQVFSLAPPIVNTFQANAQDAQSSNAQTDWQTAEDWRYRYSVCSHQCDEQLLEASGIGLGAPPSQDDVLVRSHVDWHADGRGREQDDIHELCCRLDQCECVHEVDRCDLDFCLTFSGIKKITEIGSSIVFDITVPKHHNYLAHGVWNHNSGKSAFMLGAFSHLHSQGKVKKALIAVPSAIIGQMVGEAATFISPSSGLTYNGNLGWSRDQRIEAMRDETSIHVTTRESLSNDILHLVEKHTGVSPDDFQNTSARDEEARHELVHKALMSEGIDPKDLMLAVDESHDISRRKGVKASKRSLTLDALGYHSSYMIGASGTPMKNDLSEIHDFLRKIDPSKYGDQAKFLAKYGQDTEASKRALQRLVGRHAYAVAVKPTTKDGQELSMKHEKPRVPLTDYQKQQRSQVIDDYKLVQNWYNTELRKVTKQIRDSGENRLPSRKDFAHAWDNAEIRAAVERLGSAELTDDDQGRETIGGQVMAAAALKNTALNRLYHRAPFDHNAKAQHLVNHVDELVKSGKPAVVFSASSEAAEMLRSQMEQRGIRAGMIHGGMDSTQKTNERLRFSPAQGEPQIDVLVCTDAAQTGLNLQRGKALIHYDVPLTQKAWDQRSARIFRRGQTENVEVHTLMAEAPEEEQALARMERKGKASRVFQGHDFSRGHAELIDDTGLAGQIERARAA